MAQLRRASGPWLAQTRCLKIPVDAVLAHPGAWCFLGIVTGLAIAMAIVLYPR